MSLDQLWSFLHQSSARGTRSTALGQMTWALALMVVGFLVGQQVGLPTWGLVLFGVMTTVLLVNFLALNWFFALKNPDALRSERFILTKMAIRQKNFQGDNLIGFVRALSDNENAVISNEASTNPTVLVDDKSSVSKLSGKEER